jgi:hypothetical protein
MATKQVSVESAVSPNGSRIALRLDLRLHLEPLLAPRFPKWTSEEGEIRLRNYHKTLQGGSGGRPDITIKTQTRRPILRCVFTGSVNERLTAMQNALLRVILRALQNLCEKLLFVWFLRWKKSFTNRPSGSDSSDQNCVGMKPRSWRSMTTALSRNVCSTAECQRDGDGAAVRPPEAASRPTETIRGR